MKIKIQSDVPLPRKGVRDNSELATLRKALEDMKPGDSFIWPDNKMIFRAAQQLRRPVVGIPALDLQITTRKINGEGYRVWRVR